MQNITIFTDGASRGNPGPGGWGAIVNFQKTVKGKLENNIQELGGRESKTTNNRMELSAVIESLSFVSKLKTQNSKLKTVIHTDSSYVLKGAKEWIHNWQKNGWKTKDKKDVLNKDLWEKLGKVLPKVNVEWRLIKGHSGVPANERCDEIATIFADNKKPKLYIGPIDNYSVSLKIPAPSPKDKSQLRLTARPTDRLKHKSSSKAYSYVSMVSRVIKTHKTWAECEKRVKGVSGAKFKKSFSLEDEKDLINLWKKAH